MCFLIICTEKSQKWLLTWVVKSTTITHVIVSKYQFQLNGIKTAWRNCAFISGIRNVPSESGSILK